MEKATGKRQEIGVVLIASIEKMHGAVVDRKLPKQDGGSLTLAFIG